MGPPKLAATPQSEAVVLNRKASAPFMVLFWPASFGLLPGVNVVAGVAAALPSPSPNAGISLSNMSMPGVKTGVLVGTGVRVGASPQTFTQSATIPTLFLSCSSYSDSGCKPGWKPTPSYSTFCRHDAGPT